MRLRLESCKEVKAVTSDKSNEKYKLADALNVTKF